MEWDVPELCSSVTSSLSSDDALCWQRSSFTASNCFSNLCIRSGSFMMGFPGFIMWIRLINNQDPHFVFGTLYLWVMGTSEAAAFVRNALTIGVAVNNGSPPLPALYLSGRILAHSHSAHTTVRRKFICLCHVASRIFPTNLSFYEITALYSGNEAESMKISWIVENFPSFLPILW